VRRRPGIAYPRPGVVRRRPGRTLNRTDGSVTVNSLLGSDRIGRVLGPFAAVDPTFTISLEDPSGRVVALVGAPRATRDRRRRVSRDIAADGSVAGRLVVLAGPASGEPAATTEPTAPERMVNALAEAIGASLELLLAEAAARHAAERLVAAAADRAADDGGSRLDAELAVARRIQRSFVPLTSPDIPGYDIASHYEAAREVGGDFFDVFRLRGRSSRLAIVIADVTGKGIAAALLMAFARPLLHAAIDNTATPIRALERTNKILVEERVSDLFITALCAILEIPAGRLHVANAGHEPPLVVPADGGPTRWLTDSGPLLGAFAQLGLTECVTELNDGDLVVFYTDGVTDARAASGERFGDDRLVAVVDANRAGRPADVVVALADAVREHQTGMPPADDVTIVAVRRLPRRRRRATPSC
jgi:serine phosphatase RsbU (regulator of sigma subunit)